MALAVAPNQPALPVNVLAHPIFVPGQPAAAAFGENLPAQGILVIHFDIGTRASMDPVRQGWESSGGYIYVMVKRYFQARHWNRVQYSGYTHPNISPLNAFIVMANLPLVIRPLDRIATTLQRIHMAFQHNHPAYDQSMHSKLGGFICPILRELAPLDLATNLVNEANVGRPPAQRIPPVIPLLPNPAFQRPQGSKNTAATRNPTNYGRH